MAGDWIKMRTDLFTHPKVVRIASALKADTLRAVGGLMSVWCLFDAHSEDGRLDGYTTETIDDHLRWPGFAEAMMQVKWLQVLDDGSLALPEFDTHNGQSAKRRALDKDRKKEVRKASASGADKQRTREEKRREELPSVGESSASVLDLEGAGAPAGRAPDDPVTPGTASNAEAQAAVRASIALRKLGMRVQPAMPQLLDLVARGTTLEQLCMTAAELALRKAGMFGDSDLHPELLELFASGASQQQMLLTTDQYTALRNAAPNIGYLAQTLIGRAQDAARGDGHGQSIGRSLAGGSAGRQGSAAGRAEAARRAGDARDAAGADEAGY